AVTASGGTPARAATSAVTTRSCRVDPALNLSAPRPSRVSTTRSGVIGTYREAVWAVATSGVVTVTAVTALSARHTATSSGRARRELIQGTVANDAAPPESRRRRSSSWCRSGVDPAQRGAGRRCEGERRLGDRAEVVGDEVDGRVGAVGEADLAVAADGGDGDVGVDAAGSEVDVRRLGRREPGRDQLAVTGTAGEHRGQVHECHVARLAGDGEAQLRTRLHAAGVTAGSGVGLAVGRTGRSGEGERRLGDRAEVVGDEVD